MKALADRLRSIRERYISREKLEALQEFRHVEKITLAFPANIPGNQPADVLAQLQTLQLETKPNLNWLDLKFAHDKRLHTNALKYIAQSTGTLRNLCLLIGKQSCES